MDVILLFTCTLLHRSLLSLRTVPAQGVCPVWLLQSESSKMQAWTFLQSALVQRFDVMSWISWRLVEHTCFMWRTCSSCLHCWVESAAHLVKVWKTFSASFSCICRVKFKFCPRCLTRNVTASRRSSTQGAEIFVYLVSISQSNSKDHCARCLLCDSRFNIRRKSIK